jgi:outer membrane protein
MIVLPRPLTAFPYLSLGLIAILGSVVAEASAAGTDDEKPSDHQTAIGLGVGYVPRFEGSDHYRVREVPLINIQRGRFFARVGDGIGVDLVKGERIRVGASVAWMLGYRSKDVPTGIGKLDDSIGARMFASVNFGGLTTTLSATKAVSEDDRGLAASASFAYPMRVSERLTIIPTTSVNWADDEYMSSYFGVDAGRAERSGLPQYAPSSGFKDVSLQLVASYRLTDHWTLAGAAGFTKLMDNATDSPLVERKQQPGMMIGVSYVF